MKKLTLLALFMSTLGAATVQAQAPKLMSDTAAVSFVNNAATGGKMEIAASKLALKNGQSAKVKAFASKMIADHTKANAELAKIALSKGYTQIPASAKDDPILAQSKGADFDKHYIGMMVKDHKKTVALFEKASQDLTNPELKAFASKTLPTLKQHLTSVEKIAADMGVAEM